MKQLLRKSWKSSCLFGIFMIWTVGMIALVYNAGDWDFQMIDMTGAEVSYKLPSYLANSVSDYRNSIRGLTPDSHSSGNIGSMSLDTDVHSPAIFPLLELLRDWPADDTSAEKWETSVAHPNTCSKGVVRRFDFQDEKQMKIALQYRKKEIPFIVYNVPELNDVVEKFTLSYLLSKFGHFPRMVERSASNRFMYYSAKLSTSARFKFPSWIPPQLDLPLTFSKFLRLAEQAESSTSVGESALHYMTISAAEGGSTPWIKDAFPMFDPERNDNFFIVDSDGYKGINCRFGMRGLISEAHFDSQRNFISLVKGRKRYILLPPQECSLLSLLPRGHPSARHSDVDWSDLDAVKKAGFGDVTQATEAILASGDVLYIPSYWFHYIISQDATIQCNARSGKSDVGADTISKCLADSDRKRVREAHLMSELLLREESQI